MTRREWLQLAAACWVGGLTTAARAADNRSVLDAVDHLLLGAPDLEKAVAWFAEATGVRPEVGGSHPGMGTRNALVSLGARRYLEIIAPDPAQTQFNFQIDLRALTGPRLVTWAASTRDVDAVAAAARSAGFNVFGPRDGARTRPDGSTLRWRSAGAQADFRTATVDPIPFFIEWAPGSTHPSGDSPNGCTLERLELRHPDADRLRRALATLGIEATVADAETAGIRASIATPKGDVRLK
jgi:catechol 2,3-dioxygenase-like lactoylglutathione lyase family enzyme